MGSSRRAAFICFGGYGLAGLYRVWPGISLHELYALLGCFEVACMTLASCLCVRVAVRLFGAGAELGVAVTFLSALSLFVTGELMEFALVVLVAAFVVQALVPGRDGDYAHDNLRSASAIMGHPGWLFGLGVIGMLARSDFGWLPASVLLAHAVLRRDSIAMVRRAGAVVLGSVAGLGLVALHTHWISGQWVQSSARQKLWWSQLSGFSTAPVRRLLLGSLNGSVYLDWHPGLGTKVAWSVATLLGVGVCLAWRRRPQQRVWIAAVLLATCGYAVLYRYNSAAMQGWYLANFEVPLALLAGAGFAEFARFSYRPTAVAAMLLCGWGIIGSEAGHTRDMAEFYRAGMYLRDHPELRPMGAWNAGMIGYFSGGRVTNLDGLVNDRIHDYARNGRLLDYVQARKLKTVMDFPTMVDPEAMRRDGPPRLAERGGYGDGRLQDCLEFSGLLAGPGSVAIYRVKDGCLK